MWKREFSDWLQALKVKKITSQSPRGSGLLLLPIEVSRRELHSRILLGVYAASRGFGVVIGSKPLVERVARQTNFSAIMLTKAAPRPGLDEHLFKLIGEGTKIVAQDEEAGLGYQSFQDFFWARSSLRNIRGVPYLCWGQSDYEFLLSHYGEGVVARGMSLHMTGSPRASMWGKLGREYFSEEIHSLKSSLGDYILFATSFATENHFLGKRRYLRFAKQEDLPANSQRESEGKSQARNIALVCDSISHLLKHTNHKVVIRPHPDENSKYWLSRYQDEPRVTVMDSGDALPLIFAAAALVHCGSTMAVQAHKNIRHIVHLDYRRSGGDSFGILAGRASQKAHSPEELVRAIERPMLEDPLLLQEIAERVAGKGKIDNLRRIVHLFEELSQGEPLDFSPKISTHLLTIMQRMVFSFGKTLKLNHMSTRKREPLSQKQLGRYVKRATEVLSINGPVQVRNYGGFLFTFHHGGQQENSDNAERVGL